MPIEWMPRSRREEDGWRDVRASPSGPAAVAATRDGVTGVAVPVRPVRWRLPRFPRLRPRMVFLVARVGLFALGTIVYLGVGLVHLLLTTWPPRFVLLALVLGFVYRSGRLRRWVGRREADLFLTPEGLYAGDLFVPWYQVEEVVRFNFLAPLDRAPGQARNFVALRIHDFVGVTGLSPFRAGLANLSRRRLLVLAEASELARPQALVSALEELVRNPPSRALLASPDGCRLLDQGPARAYPQSP